MQVTLLHRCMIVTSEVDFFSEIWLGIWTSSEFKSRPWLSFKLWSPAAFTMLVISENICPALQYHPNAWRWNQRHTLDVWTSNMFQFEVVTLFIHITAPCLLIFNFNWILILFKICLMFLHWWFNGNLALET